MPSLPGPMPPGEANRALSIPRPAGRTHAYGHRHLYARPELWPRVYWGEMLNEHLAAPLGARSHPGNFPHPGEARPLSCLGTAGLRGMPKPTELGTGAIVSGEAGQAGGV